MATSPIVWTCDACHDPIFGDSGYIGARHTAITSGDPIHWTIMHDRCQPDDFEQAIDVALLRTIGDVLDWTAHLSRKTWFTRSDWVTCMAAHGVDVTPAVTPAAPDVAPAEAERAPDTQPIDLGAR